MRNNSSGNNSRAGGVIQEGEDFLPPPSATYLDLRVLEALPVGQVMPR